MHQRNDVQRGSSLALAGAAGTLAGAIATEAGLSAELAVAIAGFAAVALEYVFGRLAITGRVRDE